VKGEFVLVLYSFPFQNSKSPRTSPLGLASLKRKNLPIVVTLGGIGSCYTSLAFNLIAFTPSYKLCDNKAYQRMKGESNGKVSNGKMGSRNGGVAKQTLKNVSQRKMDKFLEWSFQESLG
jgi:hypothetical protein